MTNEEIKQYITAHAPEANFDESGEWLNIVVESNHLKPLAAVLHGKPMQLDFLFCLTCVDFKTHLTMVYHLTSTKDRTINIVIKSNLDRVQPIIETVSDIWRTAEFHEREVFEMFGVNFLHHPDLRRLILEEEPAIAVDEKKESVNEPKGYWPLRKDFEDPINMIKL
jgi:NADH:ubiquinone oxidoreductase subunit C